MPAPVLRLGSQTDRTQPTAGKEQAILRHASGLRCRADPGTCRRLSEPFLPDAGADSVDLTGDPLCDRAALGAISRRNGHSVTIKLQFRAYRRLFAGAAVAAAGLAGLGRPDANLLSLPGVEDQVSDGHDDDDGDVVTQAVQVQMLLRRGELGAGLGQPGTGTQNDHYARLASAICPCL